MADLIEAASTGRASCRFCKQKIEKGELRFGERVPSAFSEGEQSVWYHMHCAAERVPQKFLGALADFQGAFENRAELEAAAKNGVENPKLASIVRVEHAPTGRARCQQCHEVVTKDELRIAYERDMEGMMPAASYLHLRCAAGFFGEAGLSSKLERLQRSLKPSS